MGFVLLKLNLSSKVLLQTHFSKQFKYRPVFTLLLSRLYSLSTLELQNCYFLQFSFQLLADFSYSVHVFVQNFEINFRGKPAKNQPIM